MKITGVSIIGFGEGQGRGNIFRASEPSTGAYLEPPFFSASSDDLDEAARLANRAFANYGRTTGQQRGRFLRTIAERIEGMTNEIIERAGRETALPRMRLQGEIGRTSAQLRLFARVAEEGSWVNARIDHRDPNRQPLPKPDIRSMLRPLGPIAVFGASNFPLAFSVAGGDTASALAAGNPVVVKAHPAHPGTSELVGMAIRESARELGISDGVFSLLFDAGTRIGSELVQHPLIKGVGFTGSRATGQALMRLVAAREDPIPFFGEMSSTNPVFILSRALYERGPEIASGLCNSFTLGAGQFCTKPGIVFLHKAAEGEAFAEKLQERLTQSGQFTLLTSGIQRAYDARIEQRQSDAWLKVRATSTKAELAGCSVAAIVFETDATGYLEHPELESEIFGPTTLLVHNSSHDQMLEIASNLEGHLTATIHGTQEDLTEFADLIAMLERKAGRIVVNGFPTGVEVCHAMVHGGPYPATSDGRSTSVGSQAIFRFARPVCYQEFPETLLPDELLDSNPCRIWRMVDGEMTANRSDSRT